MRTAVGPELLEAVALLVAGRFGLHFGESRRADFARGLDAAARDLGCGDAAEAARRILASGPDGGELAALVRHLTVGETHFFRERDLFRALEQRVLPERVCARAEARVLRIWSAGCCTGEEAYSLAILVYELLGGGSPWRVTILGTDVNPAFLEKARAAVYTSWSFREAPARILGRYFQSRGGGRFALDPAIRGMVRFAPLNLVEDSYPSEAHGIGAFDLILCRNVLMYFTPEQARGVLGRLGRSLAEGGWLALSAAEVTPDLRERFALVDLDGALLCRMKDPAPVPPAPRTDGRAPGAATRSLRAAGRSRVVQRRDDSPARPRRVGAGDPPENREPAPPAAAGGRPAVARRLADEGRLEEALAACARDLALDPVDAGCRFLRATILRELKRDEEAERALRDVLYLDPRHIPALIALGDILRGSGRRRAARRHFDAALALLAELPEDAPVAEAGGIAAGRLAESLRALA